MSQPGANNARARRARPTKQVPSFWIDADLHERMRAHLDTKGLVKSKFLERAIATQLERETPEKKALSDS